MSRILRSLVCLLLICCILVNLSPLKAEASAAGAVLGITKAASVSVPALWPIVAALAVVGVTAYGIESGAFENIANSCYSALESAGTWIDNGMTDILRTEDTEGNLQYYVPGGMLESVRSWLFHSGTLVNGPVFSESISGTYTLSSGNEYSLSAFANVPISYASTVTKSSGVYSFKVYVLSHVQDIVLNGKNSSLSWDSSFGCYVSLQTHISIGKSLSGFSASIPVVGANCTSLSEYISSPYDVSLGYLPDRDTVLDDETIVTFHPYLAEVLRTRTGGSGGSGEDENKWWLAVAYAETLEKLYQTSQQAQIENPSVVEIPDLQEGTQYEVTVEEDEDGNKKYILNPINPNPGTTPGDGTDPDLDPDPDPGTNPGTNPDPGTDPDPGTGTDPTPDSGSSGAPSKDMEFFALDLKEFFPFCIPFDLYDFFTCLNADPVAPVIEWVIPLPGGDTYPLELDLSTFDPVAQLLRRLQLLLFCVGLAFKTRDLIKG